MDAQVKTIWLEALRSGKYTQGKGRLKVVCQDGSAEHCCLGVLTEIAGDKLGGRFTKPCSYDPRAIVAEYDTSGDRTIHTTTLLPTVEACNRVGIKERERDKLASMNDSGFYSFENIAKHIEENL